MKFKEHWVDFVLDNKENLPVNYSLESYEYQESYFFEREDFDNYSKILVMKNKPIAVWPIFRLNKKYTCYGGDLCMPYISNKVSLAVQKNLSKQVINSYFKLLLADSPSSLRFEINNRFTSEALSVAYISGIQPIIGFEQWVNLNDPLDTIFSQIRKSYKSLINQSSRLFNINIHTFVNCELWEKFKLFHFQQSGRSTRSVYTWEIQKQHVNSRRAILATVQDKDGSYLGFALFNFNEFGAVYAVAAYDREKFDLPIAHGIQWEAIKYFKENGLKEYLIGYLPSFQELDSKQFNIARFKMGFGQTRPFLRLMR